MEWQDISTAPRDGTIIDLWMHKTRFPNGRRVTDMWWEDDTFSDGVFGFSPELFSHWMIYTPPTNSTGG